MKGNIDIYVVLNQQDSFLIHQQIRFQKHYCKMLTQWKLIPYSYPSNHISFSLIRTTQSFQKIKEGQHMQKHELFLFSSSTYRKSLGTIFSLQKALECPVQSSHKAHTYSHVTDIFDSCTHSFKGTLLFSLSPHRALERPEEE